MLHFFLRLGPWAIGFAAIPVIWLALTFLVAPGVGLESSSLTTSRYGPINIDALGGLWIADNQRAVSLLEQLPYVFGVWLVLGAMSLAVSLRYKGAPWALPALMVLASLAAATSQAFGLDAVSWLSLGAVAAAYLAIWMVLVQKKTIQQAPVEATAWVWVFLAWAIWIALIFIGVIWLGDLGARGPISLKYAGIRQLDAVWLASMVVLPLSVWGSSRFVALLMKVNSLWDTPRGPRVFAVFFVFALVFLVWLGSRASLGGQKGFPHISSELVRFLCGISIAWLMARYYEWGGRSSRRLRSITLSLVVLGGCMAVLIVTKDLGPVLAIGLALVPTLLVVFSPNTGPHHSRIRLAALALAWLAVAIGLRYGLTVWAPAQSWAPDRLILRGEALLSPFDARLDYASQIAWLSEAAGANGFGLGSVPWCGARALVGLAECTRSSGVPVQFGSDYVYTAVSAVWGPGGAAILLALSMALLGIVVWGASRRTPSGGIALSAARLHAWIVVVFAAMLMGQMLVSVAGNTGLIPLSGVTQPFLGLGSTALVMTAMWMGLSLGTARRAPGDVKWLSTSLNRYFVGVVVGLLLFIGAGLAWKVLPNALVKDRLVPARVVEGLGLLQRVESPDQSASIHQPLPILSEAGCRVSSSGLQQKMHRLSKHIGREIAVFGLTCNEVIAVDAAAGWALGRTSKEANRQIARPRPEDIGVVNPYRLNGCITLVDQKPTVAVGKTSDGPCVGAPATLRQLLSSSPLLHQATAAMSSSVRSGERVSDSKFAVQPKVKETNEMAVPAWAMRIHFDAAVNAIVQARPPVATSLGQGDSVTLSMGEETQTWAQELVECYSGPCKALSGQQTQGFSMLEQARARMASVLVVDVASGRVDAAASAHTPCFQAHHEGRVQPGCLQLPQAPASRPWMGVNQALYGEAMCGSLCKLEQSLGLLRVHSPLVSSTESFAAAIRASKTESFIDEMMCVDKSFDVACIRHRLEALISATADLGGWSKCAPGDEQCARLNLIPSGERARYLVSRKKIMSDPGNRFQSLLDAFPPGGKGFSAEAVKACYAGGDAKRWRSCQGEGLVATIAELFGQGNATTSPAGVAQALITLASAAQMGKYPTPAPKISVLNNHAPVVASSPNAVEPAFARQLIGALMEPVKPGGTAHLSCLKAMTGDGLMNCDNHGRWVMAAKTGTPLFPHDAWTYSERKQACQGIKLNSKSVARSHQMARCNIAPTKWFALLLGQQEGTSVRWTKAVVVLAERNWNAQTGMVDTPYDRGGNVAAEVGLRIARHLVEQAELSQASKENLYAPH